jgi:putative transposase
MSHRRARFLHIDTSTWPVVDHHALAEGRKKAFVARRMAIELYIGGLTLRDIAKQTGIGSRQLYWLLDRCLKQSEGGQVFGFQALLKGFRTGPYARTAPLVVNPTLTGHGYAGAFALLIKRYPGLAAWLQHKIDKRAVVLDQISTDGRLKTRLRGLTNLHAGFVMQCQTMGIAGADYPLNMGRMGIRSLSTYRHLE